MRSRQPRTRVSRRGAWGSDASSRSTEYEYTNYDVAQVERDYQAMTDRIYDLQLKLGLVNQTVTLEVDL